MRLRRAREMTRPPLTGMQPPERFVPAPRATKGTPFSPHQATARRTSDTLLAMSTASGRARASAPS